MRGALKPLPGVGEVTVRPGRRAFSVYYDPAKSKPDEMLAALKKAGEEARLQAPRAGPAPTADPRPEEPVQAVLRAFDRFPVVAVADPTALEEEHEFLASLIRHPAFPEKAASLVLDFGNSLHQGVLDRYISGEEVPMEQLRGVWRDGLYSPFSSWEAPVYERLLGTVRAVNRSLAKEKRLRVLVTGPPIDWRKIETSADHGKFREAHGKPEKALLASTIEREVLDRGRKCLVVASREDVLRKSETGAAARLEKRRPGSVFVITPHLGLGDRNGELEPRLTRWQAPSLAILKETWLGAIDEDEFTFAEVADGYLYLGPRRALTISRPSPEIYRDDRYFAELERRYRIQAGDPSAKLDREPFLKEKPRRLEESD